MGFLANRIERRRRWSPAAGRQVSLPRALAIAGALLMSFGVDGPRALLAEEDLGAKIAEAKTAADHEAIAEAFEKQAKAFEAAAERHQGVADEYSKANFRGGEAQAHAAALAADLRHAAKEASRLARVHRELAKAAAEK